MINYEFIMSFKINGGVDKVFTKEFQECVKQGCKKELENYELREDIGKGTFGVVKMGIHIPTRERVAIKILEKNMIDDEGDRERIAREIHILKIIRHPNII